MLPADWHAHCSAGGLERPLAPRTTWRIGGPAEVYLEPGSAGELAATITRLWRMGLPYRILGGGSNLLVADRGVRGAVVSLNRLCGLGREEELLVAGAGAYLHAVVRQAAALGLAGLEPLAGIPGRIGGAIFGNAGSLYGSIGDCVAHLDLIRRDGTLERVLPGRDFFAYRRSRVGDRIVVSAAFHAVPGDRARLGRRIAELVEERRRSQPGWVGNAGCVFRNPPGDSAGRLIDLAGCKGLRAGGIQVSQKHANFFENLKAGSSSDVERLAECVRERVRRAHGVELEWEVHRWT